MILKSREESPHVEICIVSTRQNGAESVVTLCHTTCNNTKSCTCSTIFPVLALWFRTITSDNKTHFLTCDVESIWALTPCDRLGGVSTTEPSVFVTFTAWEETEKKRVMKPVGMDGDRTAGDAAHPINHRNDRLITQPLTYGCIIGPRSYNITISVSSPKAPLHCF